MKALKAKPPAAFKPVGKKTLPALNPNAKNLELPSNSAATVESVPKNENKSLDFILEKGKKEAEEDLLKAVKESNSFISAKNNKFDEEDEMVMHLHTFDRNFKPLNKPDKSNLDLLGKKDQTVRITASGAPSNLPIKPGGDVSPHTLSSSIKQYINISANSDEENYTKIKFSGKTAKVNLLPMQEKMQEALELLQRLEDYHYTVQPKEVQLTRTELRKFALNAFKNKNFAQALLYSFHSYEISKKYFTKFNGHPLEAEMLTELLIITKCCGICGAIEEGNEYLLELRYLIENTLLTFISSSNLPKNEKAVPPSAKKSLATYDEINNNKCAAGKASTVGPIITCEPHVLAALLGCLAEILSLYKQFDAAEMFYEKQELLVKNIYGANSLLRSDILNKIALYYFSLRKYEKCLVLLQEVLNIRKEKLGDYTSKEPHPRVADCYCNLGLIYRLLGRPLDAMQCLLTSLDMRMRIYNDRQHESVQDIVLGMACIHHQAGNLMKAADLYKEVYISRRKLHGINHPSTKNVFNLLQQLEEDFNKFSKFKSKDGKHASFDIKSSIKGVSSNDNLRGKYLDEEERFLVAKNLKLSLSLLKPLQSDTLDAYRYARSIQEGYIKPPEFPYQTSSIARIRAIYAESYKSLFIPSTAILPFVGVTVTDLDIMQVASVVELQKSIEDERKRLPVINIPRIIRGIAKLNQMNPDMTISEDAIELYQEWNIMPPYVTHDGDVLNQENSIPKDINLFLPLIDETTKLPMLGFYEKPIMVPNPGVYYVFVLPDLMKKDSSNEQEEMKNESLKKTNSKLGVKRITNITTKNLLNYESIPFSIKRQNAQGNEKVIKATSGSLSKKIKKRFSFLSSNKNFSFLSVPTNSERYNSTFSEESILPNSFREISDFSLSMQRNQENANNSFLSQVTNSGLAEKGNLTPKNVKVFDIDYSLTLSKVKEKSAIFKSTPPSLILDGFDAVNDEDGEEEGEEENEYREEAGITDIRNVTIMRSSVYVDKTWKKRFQLRKEESEIRIKKLKEESLSWISLRERCLKGMIKNKNSIVENFGEEWKIRGGFCLKEDNSEENQKELCDGTNHTDSVNDFATDMRTNCLFCHIEKSSNEEAKKLNIFYQERRTKTKVKFAVNSYSKKQKQLKCHTGQNGRRVAIEEGKHLRKEFTNTEFIEEIDLYKKKKKESRINAAYNTNPNFSQIHLPLKQIYDEISSNSNQSKKENNDENINDCTFKNCNTSINFFNKAFRRPCTKLFLKCGFTYPPIAFFSAKFVFNEKSKIITNISNNTDIEEGGNAKEEAGVGVYYSNAEEIEHGKKKTLQNNAKLKINKSKLKVEIEEEEENKEEEEKENEENEEEKEDEEEEKEDEEEEKENEEEEKENEEEEENEEEGKKQIFLKKIYAISTPVRFIPLNDTKNKSFCKVSSCSDDSVLSNNCSSGCFNNQVKNISSKSESKLFCNSVSPVKFYSPNFTAIHSLKKLSASKLSCLVTSDRCSSPSLSAKPLLSFVKTTLHGKSLDFSSSNIHHSDDSIPNVANMPKVTIELLVKTKACRPSKQEVEGRGTLPAVTLLDSEYNDLITLPWQVDFSLMTLAKSCVSLALARKLNLLTYKVEDKKDEMDEEKAAKLLGEGLKKFGLNFGEPQAVPGMNLSVGGICGRSLNEGIGLLDLPASLKQAQVELPKPKQEVKKAPPKLEAKQPPAGKGPPGKGPPGKGPPGKGPPKLAKKAVTKKAIVGKDTGKTKRFLWDALFEDEIKNTVFEKIKPSLLNVNEDVEKTFAKVDTTVTRSVAKAAPKIIQLLPDTKRAYNMNILLSKFNNYTFNEIREAIIDLNPSLLTDELTESLIRLVPLAEETQAVKEYIDAGGDLTKVDRPEQFVASVMGVPLMKQRLEAHLFALNFKNIYNSAYKPLEVLANAHDIIMNSNSLNNLLFIILQIGNILNDGDPMRGNATGFKPSTLLKLDLRSTSKPVRTLLQYICDIAYNENPKFLNLWDELAPYESAGSVDLSNVEGDITQLKNGLAKVVNTTKTAEASNKTKGLMEDIDPLVEIMKDFAEEAEIQLRMLQDFFAEIREKNKEVFFYLGFMEKDSNKMRTEEIYKIIIDFAQQVQRIKKEKQVLLEKEQNKKEKEQKKKEKEDKEKEVIEKKLKQSSTTSVKKEVKNVGKKVAVQAPKLVTIDDDVGKGIFKEVKN